MLQRLPNSHNNFAVPLNAGIAAFPPAYLEGCTASIRIVAILFDVPAGALDTRVHFGQSDVVGFPIKGQVGWFFDRYEDRGVSISCPGGFAGDVDVSVWFWVDDCECEPIAAGNL